MTDGRIMEHSEQNYQQFHSKNSNMITHNGIKTSKDKISRSFFFFLLVEQD